ncbi:MAG: septum site-determining protein Ssd [Nocardioides sp.]
MTAPLLVTADDALLDELLRLAAAAGVTPEVAHDAAGALRGWAGAAIVLVGSDVAADVARASPRRRDGVFVVSLGTVDHDAFPAALAVGAECVAELPRSGGWLVERLTDVLDTGTVGGRVIGVVGGSGGAGATTFACALGQVAGRDGPAIVVDTDPLGPGVDRVLGLDHVDGVRWGELAQTTGRLSARALREAVPRRQGVAVLTWYAGPQGTLQAFAAREAVSAARRGHDLTVLDLSRAVDPLIGELAARCDQVLVVVSPTVVGLASAVRLASRLSDVRGLALVLRGAGASPDAVSRLTGLSVWHAMPDQRGLSESIDLGFGPVRSRRGPLGRAAAAVLERMAVPARAA